MKKHQTNNIQHSFVFLSSVSLSWAKLLKMYHLEDHCFQIVSPAEQMFLSCDRIHVFLNFFHFKLREMFLAAANLTKPWLPRCTKLLAFLFVSMGLQRHVFVLLLSQRCLYLRCPSHFGQYEFLSSEVVEIYYRETPLIIHIFASFEYWQTFCKAFVVQEGVLPIPI